MQFFTAYVVGFAIGLACLGCKAKTPDAPASNATLDAHNAPDARESISVTPDFPLRVRNSDVLQMLPVQGLGIESEMATLDSMRSICGRFPNVIVEVRGEYAPVKVKNPTAINGSSAEKLWRLGPYLDHHSYKVISTHLGPWGAVVRGDVIIAMRNQQHDYMANHGSAPGLPNRRWGTYVVMTFERIFEIQPVHPSE